MDNYELLISENYEKTKVSEEEIANGIDDGHGGIYSHDGKRLLKYNGNDSIYYIKEGTEVICDGVFYCNDIQYVNIPDEVMHIGKNAFRGSSIEQIALPLSLRVVSEDLFRDCSCLEHCSLNVNIETIDFEAFAYCFNLRQIELPENLKHIESMAFIYTGIQDIYLPDSVETLGDSVFLCSQLRKIRLSYSLSKIGANPFDGTEAKIINESVHLQIIYDTLISEDEKRMICCFSKSYRYTIPDGIQEIDYDAFTNARIKELIIPEFIQHFPLCFGTTIQSVIICNPNMEYLTSKDMNALSGVRCVFVPLGTKEKFIKVYSKVMGCSSSEIGFVVEEFTQDDLETLKNKKSLYDKLVPNEGIYSDDGKQIIGFRGTGKKFKIKDGTEVIGEAAFKNILTIEHIIMPDSITTIENEAFDGCDYLKKVEFSTKLISIGDAAFRHCPIKEVKFPSNLQYIGKCAFECCKIREVVLPDSLLSLQKDAFKGCFKLKYVKLSISLSEITGFAETGIEYIDIPPNVKVIGDCAFYHSKLQHIFLPEGLEKIGEAAFRYCNISVVRLPETLTTLGRGSFGTCNKLRQIRIPFNVEEIQGDPFDGSVCKVICDSPKFKVIDNILYSADGTTIVAYMAKKQEFHIPEQVTLVKTNFYNNKYIKRIFVNKILTDKTFYLGYVPNEPIVYIPTESKNKFDLRKFYSNFLRNERLIQFYEPN